jgi:acetylornithine deacetylase/succinyl-diaminopimelate desuccinylase-like protein
MDTARLKHFIETFWEDSILPSITEYIRIPNKSPAFDPQWVEHGYMEDAVTLMVGWARPQLDALAGATLEVVRLPGRTPLLFMDIPGDSDDTALLYGHLDKQPEMKGWSEGLGPWLPVLKDDKLYGRGGADDGYAIYACLAALRAMREQQVPRGRCVIMIEACEESGSYDLPFYVDHLLDRIGKPSLVVASIQAAATTSGCGSPPPCAASRRARSRCAC